MQLKTAVVNIKLFTYSPEDKSYCAEMSDLGGAGFRPLYDDAADVGITVVIGTAETRWGLSHIERDEREGELLGWVLLPTPETLRTHPQLQGYKMRLFND